MTLVLQLLAGERVGTASIRGTSKTVAALLADLEVTRSHSRPKVPNDNPYSEDWSKTLKYGPAFPERFTTQSTPKILDLPEAAWINKPEESAWVPG